MCYNPLKTSEVFMIFLCFWKEMYWKEILEHDMVNDAFEWKFEMSIYVFCKQKYRDFVTKFIVCLLAEPMPPLHW